MGHRSKSKVMKECSDGDLLSFGVFIVAHYLEVKDKKLKVSQMNDALS